MKILPAVLSGITMTLVILLNLFFSDSLINFLDGVVITCFVLAGVVLLITFLKVMEVI